MLWEVYLACVLAFTIIGECERSNSLDGPGCPCPCSRTTDDGIDFGEFTCICIPEHDSVLRHQDAVLCLKEIIPILASIY